MSVNRAFWRDRPVFLTGHTGFKGGWLSTWLIDLGARVTGYSLPPHAEGSYFALCNLENRLDSVFADILDVDALGIAMNRSKPAVVFHLAAQPLVRLSYRRPSQTFATNVMGTVNLLEAVRKEPSVKAVVVVTSDKCYENLELARGYHEADSVGGHDPYSASKGCAELVASAYQRSFFTGDTSPLSVATARAGNVFGGGDTAEDRLVPDAVRALNNGTPVTLRNPHSVRPWQHVLEPLAGYIELAQQLSVEGERWAGPWNFGPPDESAVSVRVLVDTLVRHWGSGSWHAAHDANGLHEARYLKLDCSKALTFLGWKPRLTLDKSVDLTIRWYRRSFSTPGIDMFGYSREQIRDYEHLAAKP